MATVTTLDGARLEGATRDLALGGVFVETEAPLARGTRCRLRFSVGGERGEVEFECVVARVERGGMGVRFLEIDVNAYDRLRRTLAE